MVVVFVCRVFIWPYLQDLASPITPTEVVIQIDTLTATPSLTVTLTPTKTSTPTPTDTATATPTTVFDTVIYDRDCSSKAVKITNGEKSCLQRDEVIQIGGSLSFTGQHELPSRELHRGFNLCADKINAEGGLLGRSVVFVIEDDKSDPLISADLYQKLITEDNVDLIIGPYSTELTLVASLVTEREGYPMIASGGSSPQIWVRDLKYVFGIYTPAPLGLENTVQIIKQEEFSKIAILAEKSLLTSTLAHAIEEFLQQAGMEVVYNKAYEPEVDNLSDLIGEAKRSRAEVLLAGTYGAESKEIIRLSKELGFKPRMFSFAQGPALPDFALELGKDAELVFSASYWEPSLKTPGSKQFVNAYQQRYGHSPSYHTAGGFGSCELLKQAVENVGSLDQQQIRDELQNLETTTVFGPYKVDESGAQIGKSPPYIIQIQEGKRVIVWPSDAPGAQKYQLSKHLPQLKILQWQHFVPRYDEWFDQFAQEWGEENEREVIVKRIDLSELESTLEAEIAAGEGHDLVQLPFPPAQFEPDVLDLTDLNQRAQEKFGQQVELCRKSSSNQTNGNFYAFCHGWVPDPGNYRKSMWEQVDLPTGPSSYEDLLVGGAQIRDEFAQQVGIGLAPELDSNMAVRAILWSFGASVQDQNENVVINSPQTVAAVEYMVQLYNQAMTEEVLDWEAGSNNKCLNDRNCSYILNSISPYRAAQKDENLLEIADDTFFVKALQGPNGEAWAAPHVTQSYVIPKFAEKNRDMAEKFLLDLVANYDDTTFRSELYTFPAWPDRVPELGNLLDADPFGSRPSNKLAVLKDAEKWTTNIGHPGPANTAVMEVFSQNILPKMVAKVASGELTAQEVVDEAEAEIKQIFEKWRKAGLID